TTEYFLQHFGLKTVDDLPNASELKRVSLPAARNASAAGDPRAEAGAPPADASPAPPEIVTGSDTIAGPSSSPAAAEQ
ncbi:MAG TPA: hypothetical protein VFV83_09835, partial [Chthoniobacteraceae bacterium]|nr:hypothetical protein [Chthoniobacteraceae bacterium]